MYVTPYRRMSPRNPDAENFAGAIAAPVAIATPQPATNALEWKSGIDR